MEIATLAIRVVQEGVEPAVRGLGDLAKQSDRAEASIKKLSDAYRQQQAVGAQMAAAINRERQMILLHADALEIDRRMTEQNSAAARQMALAQMDAIAMNEGLGKSAHGAAGGMGNLRQELVTATRNVLGLNPVVAQLGGLLGHMSLGNVTLIGILGGIAAIGFAYEKLTEHSRALAKAQDEAFKSLKQFNDEQRAGAGGKLAADIETANRRLDGLRQKLNEAKKAADAAAAAADAGEGGLGTLITLRNLTAAQEEYNKQLSVTTQAQAGLDLKLGQTLGHMALQLQRQTELNVATGKGADAIGLINSKYEFLNDVIDHSTGLTEGQRAAFDKVSAAMRDARDVAVYLSDAYKKQAEELAKVANEAERTADAMDRIRLGMAGLATPLARLGVQYARPGGTRGNIGGPGAPPNLGQASAGQYPTEGLFDIPKLGLAATDMVRIAESAARLSDSLGLVNRQLGAIVGGIGRVVGGGPVGIAGGIFTIITAVVQGQQQAAAALKQAVDSLNASIASFTGDTSLAGRIAGVSQQATGLRGQAISTYGRIIGESGGRQGQEEFVRAMEQINEAETKRIRLLQEEARVLREEFFTGIDKALNAARGIVDPTLAINEAYRDNIIKASSLGATMEEQARITELYRAQLLQLADATDKAFSQGLLDRLFAVTGGSRLSQPGQYTGENAAWFQRFDTYVSGLENQKRAAEILAQQTAVQTKILQDQLSVAQQALSVQQASVNATRQIVDSLRKYGDSLALSPLGNLSPTDRYLEAQRQYNAIAGLAAGGDRSALASLPETANTFLEASRAMFASSTRYQQDYQQVQAFIGTLSDQYGQQLTTEEKILAEAQKQNDALQQQIDILNKQLGAQNYSTVLDLIAMLNRNENNSFAITQLRALGYTAQRDAVDIGGGLVNPGSYYPVGYGFGPGQNPFTNRVGGTTDANGQYWPAGWGGSDNADVVAAVDRLADKIDEQTRSLKQTATAKVER